MANPSLSPENYTIYFSALSSQKKFLNSEKLHGGETSIEFGFAPQMAHEKTAALLQQENRQPSLTAAELRLLTIAAAKMLFEQELKELSNTLSDDQLSHVNKQPDMLAGNLITVNPHSCVFWFDYKRIAHDPAVRLSAQNVDLNISDDDLKTMSPILKLDPEKNAPVEVSILPSNGATLLTMNLENTEMTLVNNRYQIHVRPIKPEYN